MIMRTLQGDRLKGLIVRRPSVITMMLKGHITRALDGLHNLLAVVQPLIMRTSTDLRLLVLYDNAKGLADRSLIMRTLKDRSLDQDRLKGQVVQSLITRTLVSGDLPKGQAGLFSLIMKKQIHGNFNGCQSLIYSKRSCDIKYFCTCIP